MHVPGAEMPGELHLVVPGRIDGATGAGTGGCGRPRRACQRRSIPRNRSVALRARGLYRLGACCGEETTGVTMPRKLLLVDPDAVRGAALAAQLRRQDEYAIDCAVSAAAALERLQAEPFDLVLVEHDLPDLPGAALLRTIRAQGLDLPALLLAGSEPAEGEEEAWLVRPFRLAALVQQLRDLLRAEADAVAIGPYRFEPAAKLLVDAAGAVIRLTEKETAILAFLLRGGDEPVPRDLLLHEVWGYNPAVTSHTLETHIYRLRQKIEADPSNATILLTEPGGYRLVP